MAIVDGPVPQDNSVKTMPTKLTTWQLVYDLKRKGVKYIIFTSLDLQHATQLINLTLFWATDPETVAQYAYTFNRN